MERNSTTLRTALLVMDIQTTTTGRITDSPNFLATVAEAIAAARKGNMPVIYVTVGFRKGYPEISASNLSFSMLRDSRSGFDEPIVIDPAVAPQPGDVIVSKRRISAFTGSDLEVILRAGRIEHLVLTGISTSGVVLSTVREAADKDYRLSVLSDGCADPDPEVHRVLLAKVFPRQAEVLTVRQWLDGLNK